jgi:hypothetical protein
MGASIEKNLTDLGKKINQYQSDEVDASSGEYGPVLPDATLSELSRPGVEEGATSTSNDSINESEELSTVLSKRPPRGLQASAGISKEQGNPSDLYRSLIKNAMSVNSRSERKCPLILLELAKDILALNRHPRR